MERGFNHVVELSFVGQGDDAEITNAQLNFCAFKYGGMQADESRKDHRNEISFIFRDRTAATIFRDEATRNLGKSFVASQLEDYTGDQPKK